MANTYTVYEVIGKKEDVSDVIKDITPTETPFTTLLGTENVTNVLFQWQEDELAAPAANAQVDGFDATELAAAPTTLRENYTQILAKAIKVANTTDAVSRYGRAKETAYQMAKRSKELKRDLEYVMLNAQAGGKGQNAANDVITSIGSEATGSGGAAVARTMKSFQAQVHADHLNKTGGSSTAMTETLMLTTLEELYTAGANVNTLMIPPAEANTINAFAGVANVRLREIDGGAKKIVNVVNIYESSYGEVRVLLNRYQVNTDYLFFNPADWKRVVLRNWAREPLATVGDAERHMIVGEFSLKHNHTKSSAIVRKAS